MEAAALARTLLPDVVVLAGVTCVSQSLAAELLVFLTKTPAPDCLQELIERERDILSLIGVGLTNRAIGEKISLCEKTIEHDVTNILQKLQMRSRPEPAALANRRLAGRDT